MIGYQTFPYRPGASDSLNKLTQLKILPLTAKTFLDVGCNEGFFCGYALFDGARKVVGIDINEQFIQSAKQNFPGCDFRVQSWNDLPSDEKYDVILCSSALHYADDQEKLIHMLMDKLSRNGVLILEVGIADGNGSDWVEVKRSIDTRYFPTQNKVNSILSDYAYKYMGESSPQIGDPIPRYVYHIRRKKPYAFLLMQKPGAGKTTTRKALFQDQKVISGDKLILDIGSKKQSCSSELQDFLAQGLNPAKIDLAVRSLFSSQLWKDYLDVILQITNGETFAYDGYVPSSYHDLISDYLKSNDYFPINLCWDSPDSLDDLGVRTKAEARKYAMYLAAVRSKIRNR
ncbi:class I SAM-dependent methyltransferase [Maridesulfovibrio salexigens]|uniref:Methyltransferase type 11 n=1 Tax=Maridesulfovibrio salexigens (strain ATCC 14822 / DSM 2638 / NCIMB 8403 / VKM B-1763) TaxID=526222 RepID=C6BZ75_MARSD|nr:class I SAM-dependent methyltransferase [Maridesulfovibrio salexigens]ACS78899.1 Methyltransferase type 11 [Maridesulfovibrio salexigens DSM 2638]